MMLTINCLSQAKANPSARVSEQKSNSLTNYFHGWVFFPLNETLPTETPKKLDTMGRHCHVKFAKQ